MTTAETMDGPLVDRRVTQRRADVVNFPSQLEEGFFDFEQDAVTRETSRNFVTAREFLGRNATRHGEVITEVFTFENGRKLEVVTGRPVHQRSDVPIVTTTALATSIRGHNRYNMLQGLALGYPYVLVGPEGGHAKLPKTPASIARAVKNLCSISMAEIAENMHEVLDVTDDDDFYNPGQIVTTGESRGAMAAMGVVARAHKYGRFVLYADTTAPCFPKPRKDIQGHKALAFETLDQTSLIGQLPLKMNPKRLMHYPATLNLNPHFLAHVVGTIPTLLNGSAGRLAREIGLDAHMHNTFFSDDTWSHPEGWDEIFGDHPYVVNALRPGNHMAITNNHTLSERRKRLTGLRDELNRTDSQAARIDWERVHMGRRTAIQSAS